MRIRDLKESDVRDAVRILILSFDRELNSVFKDIELAREIFFKFFSTYQDGCIVAEAERIVGFASLSVKKTPLSSFLRSEMGFVKGLKTSLLLSYLCPKPKKGEGVVNFIAVSPLRRNSGIGSALLGEIISRAQNHGLRCIKCYVSVANDAGIGLLTKYGFVIEKMIDNSFAERNFGQRQWYLMKLNLDNH